jgi:type VI secretion system secreted protein Hcp
MAEHIHLFLKANDKDIKGESTQTSLEREGSIECVVYEQEGATPFEASTGRASGRRQYKPLVIRKRIDCSSPLLWKAMTQNEKVEGVFKFYRPNPTGDGTTEQFYTVSIKGGYISSIKQYIADTLTPGASDEPPLEEICFIFHDIIWHFTNGGAEHNDSWANS